MASDTVTITISQAFAAEWFDGGRFARALADAVRSGTGVGLRAGFLGPRMPEPATPRACTCDTTTLMRSGCKCGGV